MKKRYTYLFFTSILLILSSSQIFARSATMTRTDPDGTKCTMFVGSEEFYIVGTLFELEVQLTADIFGTLSGVVIVAFYDITINVTILGDTYVTTQNTTLPDIDTEGGSSSTTVTFNLSDITDDEFQAKTLFDFKKNNTQGEDLDHGGTLLGMSGISVRVEEEANASNIAPILAVLSIALILKKKRKK